MSGFASLRFAIAALAVIGLSVPVADASSAGAAAQPVTLGPSGLPLPRFVSLKASRVNLRIGPGRNYSVEWLYLKSGLPMEIIQEFDNWRRVRDSEGAEGWINQSLLSGKRTAIVAPWQRGRDTEIQMMASPRADARVVASIEPGAVGNIRSCNGEWCRMSFDGATGWIAQSQLWGAYPGEAVDD